VAHPDSNRENSATKAKQVLNGPVAQLNSALDFGSSGYKFESCQGHRESFILGWSFLFLKSNYVGFKYFSRSLLATFPSAFRLFGAEPQSSEASLFLVGTVAFSVKKMYSIYQR
jgi:hypothetical protein